MEVRFFRAKVLRCQSLGTCGSPTPAHSFVFRAFVPKIAQKSQKSHSLDPEPDLRFQCKAALGLLCAALALPKGYRSCWRASESSRSARMTTTTENGCTIAATLTLAVLACTRLWGLSFVFHHGACMRMHCTGWRTVTTGFCGTSPDATRKSHRIAGLAGRKGLGAISAIFQKPNS